MSRERKAWRPAVEVVDLGGRVPPHNLGAEAACLATILLRGAPALDEVADLLDASHWYADANRRIYAAALELHREGRPVDQLTVAERLRQRDEVQSIGGVSYLSNIVDATPAIAHLRAYAEIVVDLATKRRAIEVFQLAAAEGFGDTGPTLEWLDSVEERVLGLAPSRQTNGVEQAYDVVLSEFRRFRAQLDRGGESDGVRTGLVDLDAATGGMRGGELLVVAARPGMGKSAYVFGVSHTVAAQPPAMGTDGQWIRPRQGVLVFSLEMPKGQFAARLICSEARVDLGAYRNGNVRSDDIDRIAGAANEISALPLWIDDTPALSLLEVRAKARRKQREYNKPGQKLSLIVIDYLQLMKGRDGAQSREQEISEITRGLKQMAKELDVPIVALSQLNRAVETRSTKDKRPQLSDLRESGAIEQDADAIFFLYRPEYYLSDKTSLEAKKLKGYAEIIIAKQRNGPTRRVPVTFVEEFTRFENRDRAAYRDEEAA